MLTHHRPGKAETLIPNPQSDIGVFFPPLRHGCPRYFRNLSRANQRAPILRDAIPGRLNMSNPVQGRKGLRRLYAQISTRRADLLEGHRPRSEEHTSELQSLMRISYAVFCLKKKKNTTNIQTNEAY